MNHYYITTGYYPMNNYVAAMLTMLIIPSAFAQTP
ncbi:TPA: alpha/beta hydrolase, partial [Klebsiella pneumoniae]